MTLTDRALIATACAAAALGLIVAAIAIGACRAAARRQRAREPRR